MIDKLAAYEDAEEQGLLFCFPCNVGSYVYLQGNLPGTIQHAEVFELHVSKYVQGVSIYNPRIGITKIPIALIGKDVFFTYEEAETALLKQEGE